MTGWKANNHFKELDSSQNKNSQNIPTISKKQKLCG